MVDATTESGSPMAPRAKTTKTTKPIVRTSFENYFRTTFQAVLARLPDQVTLHLFQSVAQTRTGEDTIHAIGGDGQHTTQTL
jgi:hypothetical protein